MNLTGLRNNSLTNQDVPFDPCSDSRLRNSCMSLDEKTRTMSRSGSFRDGFEEGEGIFSDFPGLRLVLFFFVVVISHPQRQQIYFSTCLGNISEDYNRSWKKSPPSLQKSIISFGGALFSFIRLFIGKKCQDMFSHQQAAPLTPPPPAFPPQPRLDPWSQL